jgi:homoserine dehydrogenase
MREYAVAFLGFGNVAQALVRLMESRRADMKARFHTSWRTTGVASRRLGWWANGDGLTTEAPRSTGTQCYDVGDWLLTARADVVFESIALDPMTGQPALDYLGEALRTGAHVVSANKGPLVYGYRRLTALAESHGRLYRFESAVMDGAPVFSLVRRCLPLAGLRGVRGVFTSTATVVLEAMERGATIEEGVREAQAMGVAEANPSYDVDGWDSAVKLCAVANVLLDRPLLPADVRRTGLQSLDASAVRAARAEGRPFRLVGRVAFDAGAYQAEVAPMQIPIGDSLAVTGTTLVTHYDAEVFPGGLTVTSRVPDLTTTAYGMLADFLEVIGVT